MSESESDVELCKLASTSDKQYDHPLWRKCMIVFAASLVTLAATLSSTSLFTAAPQIAETFGTTASVIDASSAGVIAAMGFSSFIWGPIGKLFGIRTAYNACIIVLLLFTMGTAVSNNLTTFLVLRIMSGFQGTYFHIIGQTILATYFPPVQRGTATGFFIGGTVLGPPLGPCIAGIIVTFCNWRVILWLQVAVIGLGFVLSLVFIRGIVEEDLTPIPHRQILISFNPYNIVKLLKFPNILLTDMACACLSWSQYTVLAAPRPIITSRFNISSPLVIGLFYISPSVGFLTGAIIGGRWSDHTVRKWIEKRQGVRMPHDRLKACWFAAFFIVPAASLLQGWGLHFAVGGLALPIVTAFFISAGLLTAFASLNTYCAEVMPQNRLQIIANKYWIQYIFGAGAIASTTPLSNAIGVGWSSVFSATLVILGGIITLLVGQYGQLMQQWAEETSKVPSH